MGSELGGGLVLAAAFSTFLLLLALLFSALFGSFDLLSFDESWRSWKMATWKDGFNSNRTTVIWKYGFNSNRTTVIQNVEEIEPLEFLVRRLVRGEDRLQLKNTGFSCHSDLHSKVCLTYNPVIIDNTSLQIYISSNQTQHSNFSTMWVHPYARQEDKITLRDVTPVQIITQNNNTAVPACQFSHDVPAVVFSTGGFTGNLFHEFDETIIPLFITCHHFRARLQFLITDHKPWWVRKYNRILSQLSRYDVINLAQDQGVHCFTGAIVGLKFHDILSLNYSDIPGGYSMWDFQHFLRRTYNLPAKNVTELVAGGRKPVLMLISRQKSRRFVNEVEMVEMIQKLGFEVVTTTPQRMSNLDKFSSVVNSCSVMVGAHGAGLTNEVFLASGAVVVQVVPLGLDWPSSFFFGHPAAAMGLHYLDYKIQPKESSLWDTYGPDHPVIRDPQSIFDKGYFASRAIYIDGQSLNINLTRFRETLIQAKKLVEQNM